MIILKDMNIKQAKDVRLLPGDTVFACPNCEVTGEALKAGKPSEVWRGGARQQDRWCEQCGHRWTTVLPPKFQAEMIPFTSQRHG